jgi:hypothetical protein
MIAKPERKRNGFRRELKDELRRGEGWFDILFSR